MARRSGFTLIELLVVIAIIAILAAILFPVFTEAQRRGQMAVCLNNEKQLGTAFRAYVDDNNGRMPKIEPWYESQMSTLPPPANWCGALYPICCWPERGSLWRYVRTAKTYYCVVDANKRAMHIRNYPRDYPLSYSANWLLDMKNIDTIRRQSRTLLLMHESRDTINDGYLVWTNNNDDLPSDTHYKGTTCGFLDGHALYLSHDEMMKRRRSGEWHPNYTGI